MYGFFVDGMNMPGDISLGNEKVDESGPKYMEATKHHMKLLENYVRQTGNPCSYCFLPSRDIKREGDIKLEVFKDRTRKAKDANTIAFIEHNPERKFIDLYAKSEERRLDILEATLQKDMGKTYYLMWKPKRKAFQKRTNDPWIVKWEYE